MTKLQRDILERAAWTFVQAFVAFYAIGGIGGWKTALASAGAAAISVVKGSVAARWGNPNSASSLPDI